MDWSNLKAGINAAIKQNGNQEITGSVLQQVLNTIVSSVGANATFAGIAVPNTSPDTPDGPVFYLAGIPGIYPNFGNAGTTVPNGCMGIFLWHDSEWSFSKISVVEDYSDKDKRLDKILIGKPFLNLVEGAIFEHGSLDSTGNPTGNIVYRARQVNLINVNKASCISYSGSSSYRIIFTEYDKDFLFIRQDTSYRSLSSSEIKYVVSDNCEFIKLLVAPNPESTDEINLNTIANNITIRVEVEADIFLKKLPTDNIFKLGLTSLFEKSNLVQGSINSSGEVVSSSYRLVTQDYIPISIFDKIFIRSIYGLWGVDFNFYDKNYNYLGESLYISQGSHIRFPFNKAIDLPRISVTTTDNIKIAYVRLIFKYKDDTVTLNQNILDTFDIAVYKILQNEEQTEIYKRISSYKENLLSPVYYYRNAVGENIDYRLISNFVEAKEDTYYKVKKVATNNLAERYQIALFDENKELICYTTLDWINSDSIFCSYQAKYILLLYKYDNTTNKIPESIIPPYILTECNDALENISLYPIIKETFEQGTINNSGQEIDTSVRVRSKFYIPVKNIGEISCSCDSDRSVDILIYDENKSYLGELVGGYFNTLSSYVFSSNVYYIKILMKPNPDGTLYPSMINNKATIVASILGKRTLSHFVVAQWNCGIYNRGVTPYGIPNSQIDTELPKLKKLLVELNADILVINERSEYLDRNQTMVAYTTLYKHFFPYKVEKGIWFGVYSKYPISGKFVYNAQDSDRYHFVGKVNIDGREIGFIACHMTPFSHEGRIVDAQQVANESLQFTKCIVAGDFNTASESEDNASSELAPLIEAGLELGNRGYFGRLVTYPNGSLSIDNICIKGGGIDDYEVIENTYVSDHYPTKAKLYI